MSTPDSSNEEIKQVVLKNFGHFVVDLDGGSIADWLIGDHIITRGKWEQIRQEERTERGRNRALLNYLFETTNPRAFISLRNALQEEDHWLLELISGRQETVGQECFNQVSREDLQRMKQENEDLRKLVEMLAQEVFQLRQSNDTTASILKSQEMQRLETRLRTSDRTLQIMNQCLEARSPDRLASRTAASTSKSSTELRSQSDSTLDAKNNPIDDNQSEKIEEKRVIVAPIKKKPIKTPPSHLDEADDSNKLGTTKLCSMVLSPEFQGYGFNFRTLVRSQSGLYSHVIDSVDPDSPAKRSGLQANDLIVKVNGWGVLRAPHREVIRQMKAIPGKLSLSVGVEEREKFLQKTRFGSTPDESDNTQESKIEPGFRKTESQQRNSAARSCYCEDPLLFHSVRPLANSEKFSFHGLAIINNHLYTISRNSHKITVYDMVDYCFVCRFYLKDLVDPWDIASCGRYERLYVLNRQGCPQILSVDSLSGSLIKGWSPDGVSAGGISVTKEFTVLLTVPERNRLNEYRPDGELIREIRLLSEPGLFRIAHALKLNSDQYAISHGDNDQTISLVNAEGRLLDSFGSNSGLGSVDGLVHLTADENNSVIVADYANGRVLVHNFQSRVQRILVGKQHGLRSPYRVCLDESNRRLLVIDSEYSREKEQQLNSSLSIFYIK